MYGTLDGFNMNYIISLINTHAHHKYISIWGKGGHCFSKEHAKTFEKPLVIRSNPDAVMEVPLTQIEGLFVETVINNRPVHVLPNTPVIRRALGVKITKEGLVKRVNFKNNK